MVRWRKNAGLQGNGSSDDIRDVPQLSRYQVVGDNSVTRHDNAIPAQVYQTAAGSILSVEESCERPNGQQTEPQSDHNTNDSQMGRRLRSTSNSLAQTLIKSPPVQSASNLMKEVGRTVTSPRFQPPITRRDNLNQPLLTGPAGNHTAVGIENINMEPVDNGGLPHGLTSGPSPPGGPPQPSIRGLDRSSVRSASSNRSSTRGSVISFHHINYVAKSKKMPWSKTVRKVVLNDVSGIIRPGLNAIMGPTGSGKSSLLDVLAGRKDPEFLEGMVLVDGNHQPHNFKCMSGYVVQDDIVMGTLTVKENLNFSSALRLPRCTTKEQRKQKVDDVIEELALTNVADSKIGTELIRGVSGGERKRTNIGMELITDPSVLFLDEPTTGLDAFTANSVIKTLKNLALRGRTIIFSIHQPKYSIYKLFDTLTLVCKGQLVYHGPCDYHPLNYFKSIGYYCEDHNNPPDFFMDIMHGEVKLSYGLPANESSTDPYDTESLNGVELVQTSDAVATVSERLINIWKTSAANNSIVNETDRILQHLDSNVAVKTKKHVSYVTSFWNQLIWVSWRTALNLFRNPQASVIQLAVYLFFALSIGTVYHPLNLSAESGIQNRMGLFFFSCIQMVFVNLAAVDVFIKERIIFIHENSSGYYRVSAYFLAKVFCDMLPIKALPVILFMPILYFMAGLRLDAGAFFMFELNLVLTTLAAGSIAFFVSASFSVFGVANMVICLIYVFMMVFGGYLINIGSMGQWLSWCRYLSVFRYCLSCLAVNEFHGLTFCYNSTSINYINGSNEIAPRSCIVGANYLSEQDIPANTPWDLWQTQVGLTIILLFFGTLCYIQLRRINKYK